MMSRAFPRGAVDLGRRTAALPEDGSVPALPGADDRRLGGGTLQRATTRTAKSDAALRRARPADGRVDPSGRFPALRATLQGAGSGPLCARACA